MTYYLPRASALAAAPSHGPAGTDPGGDIITQGEVPVGTGPAAAPQHHGLAFAAQPGSGPAWTGSRPPSALVNFSSLICLSIQVISSTSAVR